MDDLNLPEELRARLKNFTAGLKDLYRDTLISVILYGSASSGEFAKKYSNVNVMVVLDDTSLANLSKAYSIINSRKFKMISPVFFTEGYIKSSLDVFPIEFLDITENYTILYGRDLIKGLKVDNKNLRFQCEQELKSKLINIKKLYLSTKNKTDLENLLFKTFTSALHIMRNILRLKGIHPPYLKEEILNSAEKALGVDTAMLSKILWAKNKKMSLAYKDVDALLSGLVKELESIVSVVDKL
ncbi:MAG: hypothetical protein NTY76_03965 [Candidatus Omnitrophica bacterium]|nr:hypothetical protein [Candidatus Omnitrophota bacterium]